MYLYAFQNIFYVKDVNKYENIDALGLFGYTDGAKVYNLDVTGKVIYNVNGIGNTDKDATENAGKFKTEGALKKKSVVNNNNIYVGGIVGNANNTTFVRVSFNNTINGVPLSDTTITVNDMNYVDGQYYQSVAIGNFIGKMSGIGYITDSATSNQLTLSTRINKCS